MTYLAFNGLLQRIGKIQRQLSGTPESNHERLAEKMAEVEREKELEL